MKAKKKAERQRYLEKGQLPKKYDCPVYKCKCKYHTEDELIDHYDKTHTDLVQLGLRLRRSKKSKRELKKKKEQEEVEQIHLDGGQARKKDSKKNRDGAAEG